METTALGVIVSYLAGVPLLGALMVRRSKGASEWSVAGGGMSTVLVAFGLAGARIGGAARTAGLATS